MIKEQVIEGFVEELSSKKPVPGGGGASAMAGALGTALGLMVGNLTVGKKRYAAAEAEVYERMTELTELQKEMLLLADEDARVFAPLAAAYSLPSGTEEEKAHKEAVMEENLRAASLVPLQIMEKCADLLPDYFSFVKGIVDSQDLSLNISREMLQKDNQLKLIHNALEKKIKNELHAMLVNDREKYETFWKNFGRQIKYGVVGEYGAHKDLLQDLLLFWSSTEKKLVTLDEYVSRMKEDQKVIYYAAGDTVDKIDKLPQLEALKDQGTEILYFTEEVDEFVAQTLRSYKDKEFRSAMDGASDESAQEKAKEEADTHKDVFAFVKETLGDAVAEVKPSTRLKSHPVCLTAGEGLSFEMEKYFQLMQPDSSIKAQRILELNTEHPAFTALENAVTADPEKAKIYAKLLYDQALLIAGLPLDDPSGYTDLVCGLMK